MKVKLKIDPYVIVEESVAAGIRSAMIRFWKHRDCHTEAQVALMNEMIGEDFAYVITSRVMDELTAILDLTEAE